MLAVLGWAAGGLSPNADGLLWFASEVLPRIRRRLPWARLFVTGGTPPPEVAHLAGPAIVFLGHVSDLATVYSAARVAIVPLRYGSGVKNKTVEALLFGVPVVATSIGAEGIDCAGLEAIDVCDDPEAFAAAATLLLSDRRAWDDRRRTLEQLVAHWEEAPVGRWTDVIDEVCRERRRRALAGR